MYKRYANNEIKFSLFSCISEEGGPYVSYGHYLYTYIVKPYDVLKLKNTLVKLSSTEFTVFLIYNTRFPLFTNAKIWDKIEVFYFPGLPAVVSTAGQTSPQFLF